MKTWKKIVLLIGILLLAFGLTVLQIAHHRGESFATGLAGLNGLGTNSAVHLDYDQKGYTVLKNGEESFSAGEVEALQIDWISGGVSVEALPEKQLTVLVPQSLTLSELTADAASASVALRGLDVGGTIDLDSASGSLRAEDCRCAALDLDSASGSQHVLRCEARGAVDADSTSGSITVEELGCLSLNAGSTSGSQKIGALSCDTLKLSSVSGSQRVSGLECRTAESSSTSGSVHIAFVEKPASVEIETTSGSVELSFPKGTGIDLDYDRTSGSLHGEVLRGPIPVNVETTSGSLTIRYQ